MRLVSPWTPQRPPSTRDREHIPRVHRFGNWVISGALGALFGVKITDVCSGMYLFETEEAKKHGLQETGFNIEIEASAQSALKFQPRWCSVGLP